MTIVDRVDKGLKVFRGDVERVLNGWSRDDGVWRGWCGHGIGYNSTHAVVWFWFWIWWFYIVEFFVLSFARFKKALGLWASMFVSLLHFLFLLVDFCCFLCGSRGCEVRVSSTGRFVLSRHYVDSSVRERCVGKSRSILFCYNLIMEWLPVFQVIEPFVQYMRLCNVRYNILRKLSKYRQGLYTRASLWVIDKNAVIMSHKWSHNRVWCKKWVMKNEMM